jgi:hypothetical protein
MMGVLWTEDALKRRQILTDEERQALLGMPQDADSLARLFTLSRSDRHLVAGRLSDTSRLGFAVQLALLRHPGTVLANLDQSPEPLVIWLAAQLGIPAAAFAAYARRPQTMTDHARRLALALGLRGPMAADLPLMIEAAAQAAWGRLRIRVEITHKGKHASIQRSSVPIGLGFPVQRHSTGRWPAGCPKMARPMSAETLRYFNMIWA